jgi:hypothetical protein
MAIDRNLELLTAVQELLPDKPVRWQPNLEGTIEVFNVEHQEFDAARAKVETLRSKLRGTSVHLRSPDESRWKGYQPFLRAWKGLPPEREPETPKQEPTQELEALGEPTRPRPRKLHRVDPDSDAGILAAVIEIKENKIYPELKLNAWERSLLQDAPAVYYEHEAFTAKQRHKLREIIWKVLFQLLQRETRKSGRQP